ncbi:MAG: hypothetical protein JSW70_06965 [Syntrophobacterales bacterium]|nr:MAG: hypothetical protein JSW70_06965 [Syntrophobacterales bacterium]
MREILNQHKDSFLAKRGQVIKEDRRTAITLFEFAGKRICVKEYRYKSIGLKLKELLRGSKARKGWMKGNEILKRGIKGINPVALLEKRRWGYLQEAFLIMETHPNFVELRRYVKDIFGDPQQGFVKKKAFIKELAVFLAKLNCLRIAHRDLKISNILVKEVDNSWCFALTDWEDLELDKQITGKRLIKTLVQMNTSTPLFVSLRDRSRFLKQYLTLIGRDDIKTVYREVIRWSEKRGWVNLI